jgi:hypothetical protein
MKPSRMQEKIMREALASDDLRVPALLARLHETKVALTSGGGAAWMRYVEQNLRLELTRYGAATLGSAELAEYERKSGTARLAEEVADDPDGYAPGGRWHSLDARLVFSSAYGQARLQGLSAAAAQAIFQNVVAAVEQELRARAV